MLQKGLLAAISVFAIFLGPNVQGILSIGVILWQGSLMPGEAIRGRES